MDKKKEKIIEVSIDNYKKLPKDKQMFVLGYMQGILCNHADRDRQMQSVT